MIMIHDTRCHHHSIMIPDTHYHSSLRVNFEELFELWGGSTIVNRVVEIPCK